VETTVALSSSCSGVNLNANQFYSVLEGTRIVSREEIHPAIPIHGKH
jgi:hypothetical protein